MPVRAGGDDGVATVLAAVMVAAIITVVVMVVDVGAAVSARHRAQSAADLAALAGAASAIDVDAACAAADRLARANAGSLRACSVDGFEVVVRVGVPVSLAVFGADEAVAVARAGPE
ncbi:Rv3654c family TadE-like protein [Tsukamurella spumae]|uniref:Rv3654c family TadE-like protein n=1 Tax=Tsukamurella spumae TaxID=44753 RepID=UPI0028B0B0C8|nr:Rv3654c family TadE-like protein [Tsukamurella spumae]